jgi:hypothetical protein
MISLMDLLIHSGIDVSGQRMKIHLACWNGWDDPLDVYFAGNFQSWQERQSNRNFQCDQILSLIDMGNKQWLFAGVYQTLDCRPHHPAGFLYSTRLLPKQEDLIGRLVLSYKRTRNSYIWFKPSLDLKIIEIRRGKLTLGEFPGYNSILISHSNLKTITEQRIASWHSALSNIKGVYLITDTSSGRHYVGKASGTDGIWERWLSYAKNGHGGNKELKSVLEKNGDSHMRNFQYSVLEIADSHASEKEILARESYWMNALKTREYGLN